MPLNPLLPQPQATKQSTGFTNLQKYLGANKQAGQQVVGTIASDVQKKQEKVVEAQTEAQKVGEAIKGQQAKVGSAGNIVSDIGAVTGDVGSLAAKEGDISYLTKGGYLSEADKAREELATKSGVVQSKIGGIQQRAENLKSESGRYGILQDVYKRPSYTTGQQRLDQLFLQQSGEGALGSLQEQTAKQAAAAKTALGDVQTSGQKGLEDIISRGGQASKDVIAALTGGLGSLTSAQESEFTKKQAEQTSGYDALVKGLQAASAKAAGAGNISVSQDLVNQYKTLTGQDLADTNIFGTLDNPTDIANLFKQTNLETSDVVTSDELARMNLLSRLGGGASKYTTATGDVQKNLLESGLKSASEKAYEDLLNKAKTASFSAQSDVQDPFAERIATSEASLSDISKYLNKEGRFSPEALDIKTNKEADFFMPIGHEPIQGMVESERKAPQEAEIKARSDILKAQNEAKIKSQIEEYLKQQKYGRQIRVEK